MGPLIVVYSTIFAPLNSNARLVGSLAEAVKRVTEATHHVGPYSPATIMDAIENIKPDIVLGFGGLMLDQVDLSVVQSACRQAGAVHVLWGHDDPYELDYGPKGTKNSDFFFTNDLSSVRYYGGGKVHHLPLAADSERHFFNVVPFSERPIDFFFCGHGYPNRRSMVSHLSPLLSDYNTVILGSGWDESYKFCTNRRVNEDDLLNYYGKSKFTLNIGRVYNLANRNYGVVPSTPGPRTFEAAAAGALQVCFRDSYEIDSHYPAGVGTAYFDDIASLVRVTRSFLEDPVHAEAVISAGVKRTRDLETFEVRVKTIVETVGDEGRRSLRAPAAEL